MDGAVVGGRAVLVGLSHMKSKICALILAGCAICGALPESVLVTGSTLDCLAGKVYHTAGVEVFILPRSPQLIALIDSVLKSNDENVFDRFDKLLKFVKGGKVLAHTKSDRTGSFRAEIPAVEDLVVFGYLETEDNPLYWMYTEANLNHRPTLSVTLDYCKRH